MMPLPPLVERLAERATRQAALGVCEGTWCVRRKRCTSENGPYANVELSGMVVLCQMAPGFLVATVRKAGTSPSCQGCTASLKACVHDDCLLGLTG